MGKVTPVTIRGGQRVKREAAALSSQKLDMPGDWDKVLRMGKQDDFLLPVGTHWVERDVLDISSEVHRISEGKLRVASCTCGNCVNAGHFPHVVVEHGTDGRTTPVFGFREFGPHILERIHDIHVKNNPNGKAMKANELRREELRKNALAAQREGLEIIQAALASSKQDWRGPNGLRTDPTRTRL